MDKCVPTVNKHFPNQTPCMNQGLRICGIAVSYEKSSYSLLKAAKGSGQGLHGTSYMAKLGSISGNDATLMFNATTLMFNASLKERTMTCLHELPQSLMSL